MALSFEAITALMKADISLVVMFGTIKLRVTVSILKIPDHPVENSGQSDARGHIASVEVIHSDFGRFIFLKFKF